MIFCPYCLSKQEHLPEKPDEFRFPAHTLAEDNPNSKSLEIAVHLRGCGKVFLVIRDMRILRPTACFKLPADWAFEMPSQNPPPS